MTLRFQTLSMTAFLIATATSAVADPTVVKSVFATGSTVGGTQPDSITTGDGSVWVEYGNGAVSTGGSGSSTIERYSPSGALQQTYTISGLVDGLKFNPVTGMVWALQNNDGNSTLSFINPTTNTVSSPPLSYAVTSSSRGYDDVAFLNGKVYLSYSNPVNPGDSVLQMLTNSNSNSPSGPLTTTSILTAQQTGQPVPDIDSLKSTPNGDLVLTSEGDGPSTGNPIAEFTLISHPGTASQTVTNVQVTDAGQNVVGMDDVIFPGAKAGWLYVADTGDNAVWKLKLTGLDPNMAIVALGGLNEVALVNPLNGDVGTVLLSGISAPHGMDFVASVPEPSTWAMLLAGFLGLGFAGHRRARRLAAA
jgi:hypothetical protein